jgi:poly(3-hydroxybutyrate) depolymerase
MRGQWAAGAAMLVCLTLTAVPALAQEASAGPTSTATPAPTPSVIVTRDLAYEPADSPLAGRTLDIYAPAGAGPWPVVVMFHGFQGSKADQAEYARKVADLGFVVFAPTWDSGLPTIGGDNLAYASQAACAVEYARSHAGEYGGDTRDDDRLRPLRWRPRRGEGRLRAT